jgi:hypothetical protein
MNPTDLATRLWKPFRSASEHVAKALDAHQEAQRRLAELRAELAPAEARDELELGKALLASKKEPKPEADAIREQISAQERRVSALERAYRDAQEQLTATIQENRRDWHRDAMRALAKARERYTRAVDELELAREDLSSAATLCEWVSSGGAATADAANDRLSGDGALGFNEVVMALRADLEHLALYDSTEGDVPRRIAFERIQRVLQP